MGRPVEKRIDQLVPVAGEQTGRDNPGLRVVKEEGIGQGVKSIRFPSRLMTLLRSIKDSFSRPYEPPGDCW